MTGTTNPMSLQVQSDLEQIQIYRAGAEIVQGAVFLRKTALNHVNSLYNNSEFAIAAQITKWQNDLEPLKTYPIVSFGIAYSFNLRGNQVR